MVPVTDTTRRRDHLSVLTEDLVSDYCDHLRRLGRAPATVALRRRILRQAERALGDLARADPDDLAAFVAAGHCPETRRQYASTLRGLSAWGRRHGVVPDWRDALPSVRVPRHLPHPVPPVVVARLLDLPDPYDVAAVLLMAYAGLRVGEVPGVERCDVERTAAGGHRVRVVGKGGVERLAPIPAWAADAVLPWLPVPRASHTIGVRVGRAIKAAGGQGGAHGLRHFYATQLLAACHDLRIVQEALGHASPTTTAIYAAIDSDAATAAVEALPRPRLAVA